MHQAKANIFQVFRTISHFQVLIHFFKQLKAIIITALIRLLQRYSLTYYRREHSHTLATEM